MKLVSAVFFSAFLVSPIIAGAQEPLKAAIISAQGRAFGELAEVVELQGVVTAIDPKVRIVAIKGGSGNDYQLQVGPEVANFDQLRVGDLVTVNYLEAVAVELKKLPSGFRERSEKVKVAHALPGQKPAAILGKSVRVVADVQAIDASNGRLTLRGPSNTVELWVRNPNLLSGIKVGDQVEARYATGVAVSVTGAK